MTHDLSACPFCGARPSQDSIEGHPYPSGQVVYGVICDCGGQTSGNYTTKEFAIAAWNRRAVGSESAIVLDSPAELVSNTRIEAMLAHIGPPSADLAVSYRTDELHSILSEVLSRRCVDVEKEAKLDRQNKALVWCMARLKHRSYIATLAAMVGIDPVYPPPEHETIVQSGNT